MKPLRSHQPDLFEGRRPAPAIPEIAPDDPNIECLVKMLAAAGDWMTAAQLSEVVKQGAGVAWCDRKIRALAKASGGRVAGGQKGYKLVTQMTHEEYNHYRHWMLSQCDEIKRRVLESDKVFYARKPVEVGS
jgi:hypothetical protein